jgi:hypothetical protein
MSRRIRTKGNADKQEITLMTLLANESTSDARKLLKKYNKEDANSFQDLEVKLAKLYYEAPDKVAIEKEMAEIHPHKNWLFKVLKPIEKEEVKIEEKKEPTIEIKSNMEGQGCGCSRCRGYSNACGCQHSGFDGSSELFKATEPTNVGLIAIFGILALTFYAISTKK